MATNQPVQLSEKVQYLIDQISKRHWQVRNADDFELKLNFVQFVDLSIDRLNSLEKSNYNSPIKPQLTTKPQEKVKTSTTLYNSEKQRLQLEKTLVQYQHKELKLKTQQSEIEGLKLKMANKEIQTEKMKKAYDRERFQNQDEVRREKQLNRNLRQEIQKLIRLNQEQDEEVRKVKEERNKSQTREVELRQKYYEELGQLERLGEKNTKYLYRNTKGLRHIHTYTNISNEKNMNQRILTVQLPATIEIHKIVYGIKIGIQAPSRQILYYEKLELFEKQLTKLELKEEALLVTYKKRKDNNSLLLKSYKIHTPEVIVMLYGKGDSITIHQ